MKNLFRVLVVVLFVGLNTVQAQQRLGERPYNPVVLTGADLPNWLHQPVASMRFYRYNATLDSWTAVPFQIDERDGTWSYFRNTNGLLDANDEVVFMAQAAGDSASVSSWPDDPLSRDLPRLALRLIDPLTEAQGWVYGFQSTTLPPSAETLIQYHADDDRVESAFYRAVHLGSGFQEEAYVKYADGSNSPDFLDRQKLRLKIKIDMGALGRKTIRLREEMDEDVEVFPGASIRVSVTAVQVAVAPSQAVRINRRNRLDIYARGSFLGFSVNFRDTLDFLTTYYPAYTEWRAVDMEIPQMDVGDVTELRMSIDLNSNAVGMVFQNAYNPETRIDAFPDEDFDATLEWPGSNWYLIRANPEDEYAVVDTASMVGIITLGGDPMGSTQNLFYQDIFYNTADEGDRQSLGDTGLQMLGRDITGTFTFYGTTYYLPANLDMDQAGLIVDRHNHPVTVSVFTESYAVLHEIVLETVPTGQRITVDGSELTAPAAFFWEAGSVHALSVPAEVALSADERLIFSEWSHGAERMHNYLVGTAGDTLSAAFGTEYFVTTAVLPQGAGTVSPPPPGVWAAAGAALQLEAAPMGFYRFTGWSGDVGGAENPVVLTVDSAATVTAVFGNDTPVIALADTALAEDDTLQLGWAWLAAQVIDDNADSTLTFGFTHGPSFIMLSDSVARETILFSKAPNWFGSDTLRVTVTDPLGETASATMTITFVSAPDAPNDFALIAPEDGFQVLTWPETLDFQWEAATDPDVGDSLLYVFQLDTTDAFPHPPLIHIGRLHRPFYTLSWPLSYGDGPYFWRVLAVDRSGLSTVCRQPHALRMATPVAETDGGVPERFDLAPNYPNPFNGGTKIRYAVPRSATVSITVYNSLGQRVQTLVSARHEAGRYETAWQGVDASGRAMASGIYLLRIEADGFSAVRRMLLLR